ncbi:S8 family peptidase [Mitsuaria sp. GD03876]|uniref:S8 family peptidase n=1 Tax=Mitsuaria sp. GD03876 TaxID=2975399 RepID=UPI00244AD1AC|nr:S8 family peptidase [Mitsuaria sp. GD03876]MDH0863566.1 S8 family peptidase [Mitsuaria sp. GD03876]
MSVLSLPRFLPTTVARLAVAVAVMGVFGTGMAGAATATAVKPDQQADFARVIVRFKPQADAVRARPLAMRATSAEARDIAQVRGTTLGMRHAAALQARVSLDERTHVYVASGVSSAELARRLAADGEVESVQVDRWWRHFAVPNDPLYATAPALNVDAGQWYLKAPDATVVSSINAPAAWDKATGSGVVVAVLDTGARMDHPDLANQFKPGYDMIGVGNGSTSLATANDGDGPDNDPSDPGDWVSQSDIDANRLGNSCTKDDIANSSWHGTRVSGLIAAVANNGLGMAGLAYNAKILPVRVLGKCGGWASDIAAGMRWAAGLSVPGLPDNPNPAKIINMSLGGDGACTDPYQSAITAAYNAGVTVVVAAGNGVDNKDDETKSGGIAVGTPANCANVIAVAGLRHAGSKVGFSNLGPQVTISAPGGNCVNTAAGSPCLYPILSTTNSGTTVPVAASNAYTYGTGTSFSTPLVSATVALMLQVDPTLTPDKIKAALRSSARPFVAVAGVAQCVAGNSAQPQQECNCTTATCGAGMLDANAAIAAVTPATTPTTPPTTPTTPVEPTSGGGGGGGGAMSAWWLAALALAALALRWPKRA